MDYSITDYYFLPSGVFLLEHWDENKKGNTPHFGLTVTVRDPNHEVQYVAFNSLCTHEITENDTNCYHLEQFF